MDNPTAPADSTQTTNQPRVATSPVSLAIGGTTSALASPAAELTLGELVDRINSQWVGMTHFREINSFTTGAAVDQSGSPVASSPASERTGRSIREVALPNQARYVAEENDQLVFEMIVIGDEFFARGTVAMLLDPTVRPGEWIVTNIDTVANNPMLGESAASQLAVLSPPSYEVPERLRPQPVRDLGVTEAAGTTCALYGAADTTTTGARIDFTFGVDAEDRLCFVQTQSIGISSQYVVEEIDQSVTIEPPANARPIASPGPSSPVPGTAVGDAAPASTP